jgi:hypothetical protein
MAIWCIMSCTSVSRYQNFAGISFRPEERGSRFVRNNCVFGANNGMSVSRMRLSEIEDFQLNLIEMRYKNLDWIRLAQFRVNRWTAVKEVKKFAVP